MHAQWFACRPDAEAAIAAYEGQGPGRRGRRPRPWRYHTLCYGIVAASRHTRRTRRGRPAKTDPLPMPETEANAEKRPDADNLLGIYAALADREKADVVRDFAGKQFSEFKAALTELAVAKLGPIGAEMQRLMKDPGHVDAILRDGAERARALAEPILSDAYKAVGFLKP